MSSNNPGNSNQPSVDPEGQGYWKLTQLVRQLEVFGELAIFNRYSDLVLFDLHLYSAELNALCEEHLGVKIQNPSGSTESSSSSSANGVQTHHEQGRHSKQNLYASAKCWADLKQSGATKHFDETFRPVLYPFLDALVRASSLANLPKAQDRNIEAIAHLMDEGQINLTGSDRTWYKNPLAEDLVALKPDTYHDFVSRFIAKKAVRETHGIFSFLFGQTATKMVGIKALSSTPIKIIGSLIITSFASLGLTMNTLVLYHTPSIGSKLGIIAVFSWLHALFVSVFRGSAIEAVTAISTFAAVQVFFITATQDSPSDHTTNAAALQL